MSYNIYTTEGVVLESFSFGESDRLLKIFTKELGLITVIAKGVRNMSSKNRYGLQDLSISSFSLVRGRDSWRVTSIFSQKNLHFIFSERESAFFIEDQKKLRVILNLLSLIKRFIQGEEKNEYIYNLVLEVFSFLKKTKLKEKDFSNLDLIIFIKVLSNLGYFDKNIQENIFFKFIQKEISEDLILDMNKIKIQTKKIIDKSIENSHL